MTIKKIIANDKESEKLWIIKIDDDLKMTWIKC